MRFVAAALVAAVLTACGTLPLGEAEIPEICQDLDSIHVPASPLDTTQTVHSRTPLEIPPELAGAAASSQMDVKLLRVMLTAEGVSDLGFVDAIELSTVSSGAPTPVASYERSTAAPTEITLAPAEPVDLAALSGNGAAEMDASITGNFPRSPWTLLPRVCYAARAALTWSAQ